MLRLMWLLGWLRPRTAARRLVALAVVAAVVGGGTLGFTAIIDRALDGGRAAVGDLVDAVARVIPGTEGDRARVTHVVDGDTIDIRVRGDDRREETRVRLVGIDTPESKKPGTPVECGALEAEHRLLQLTFTEPRDTDGDGLYDAEGGTGRSVVFTKDSTGDDVDRYGRSLGYVALSGRERTLQELMLRSGWADVYVYRDREFDQLDDFRAAARRARRAGVGVHASCGGDFHRAP